MANSRLFVLLAALFLLAYGDARAQTPAVVASPTATGAEAVPTAEEVMARVGLNQDRGEAERTHYIYVQHAKVVSRKGERVMCEEVTDFRVTPSNGESHLQLLKLDGKLLTEGRYVSYTTLPLKKGAKGKEEDQHSKDKQPQGEGANRKDANDKGSDDKGSKGKDLKDKDLKDQDLKSEDSKEKDPIDITIGDGSLDRDLVESMRDSLTNDNSKDGISARLFPLTLKGQAEYDFHLAGRERMNGRDVFHIVFHPKDKAALAWKGDAWIDTTAYEPVVVTTELSRNIPFAVRTLLGTNVPGLGFTVTYAAQADGVWFPVSFSTEFKVHVLFFFKREMIIDARNSDFEKTRVTSTVVTGSGAQPQ